MQFRIIKANVLVTSTVVKTSTSACHTETLKTKTHLTFNFVSFDFRLA